MTLQAIETRYNGYRFRSRLEARWALVFDKAGIKYEYEAQGYNLTNGLYYLPDFWLPGIGFVEIKPMPPTKQELQKLYALTDHSQEYCFLIHGTPDPTLKIPLIDVCGYVKNSGPVYRRNGVLFVCLRGSGFHVVFLDPPVAALSSGVPPCPDLCGMRDREGGAANRAALLAFNKDVYNAARAERFGT